MDLFVGGSTFEYSRLININGQELCLLYSRLIYGHGYEVCLFSLVLLSVSCCVVFNLISFLSMSILYLMKDRAVSIRFSVLVFLHAFELKQFYLHETSKEYNQKRNIHIMQYRQDTTPWTLGMAQYYGPYSGLTVMDPSQDGILLTPSKTQNHGLLARHKTTDPQQDTLW